MTEEQIEKETKRLETLITDSLRRKNGHLSNIPEDSFFNLLEYRKCKIQLQQLRNPQTASKKLKPPPGYYKRKKVLPPIGFMGRIASDGLVDHYVSFQKLREDEKQKWLSFIEDNFVHMETRRKQFQDDNLLDDRKENIDVFHSSIQENKNTSLLKPLQPSNTN